MSPERPTPPSAAAVQVLAQLEGFISEDPDNEGLRAEAFEWSLRAGHLESARRHLDAGLGQSFGATAWSLREAHWLMAVHDWPAARHLLSRVLDDPAASDESCLVARLDLAFVALQVGEPQAGLHVLAPLVGGGLSGALPLPSVQVAWLRLLHHDGRPREVVALARDWSERGALDPEALGVASLAALDAEGAASSIELAGLALAARPDQVEALTAMGSALLALEQPAAAMEYLSRSLAMRPNDGRCLSARGFALMLSGALADAGPVFRRALEAMPRHVGTWHGLGWSALLSGHAAEARRAFERAIELDRGFAESHGALAVALATTGQVGAARRSLEVAKRLDPLCVSADYARALIDGRAGDRSVMEGLVRRSTIGSLVRGRGRTSKT